MVIIMKVLFIGNSYTYVNDLPKMVSDAARSVGVDIDVTSNVKGGGYLSERLDEDNEMYSKLAEEYGKSKFDVVVLQEQSFLPVKDKNAFLSSVLGLRKYFSKGERFVFYQTWAYKDGSDTIHEHEIEYDAMWSGLRDAYREAAMLTGGIVCPVGDGFALAKKEHPTLDFYHEDGSHLILIGTYLAACIFCGVLTGKSPLLIATPEGIDEDDAEIVRSIAEQVTFPAT